MKITAAVAPVLLAAAFQLFAQNVPDAGKLAAMARALSPSAVRVEYQIQSDKGDEPRGGGLMDRCPGCGRMHVSRANEFLEEERPLEAGGFLFASNKVVTASVQIHPRFIKAITVRSGTNASAARVAGYALQRGAVCLELEQPLPGAKPLVFKTGAKGPLFLVNWAAANGDWALTANPLPFNAVIRQQDRPFTALNSAGLVANASGTSVGLAPDGELPADGSWKGSPAAWPWVSAADMDQRLAVLESRAAQTLLRVELNFRSPKKNEGARFRYDPDEDSQDGKATERNVIGVTLPGNRILVLASLKPKVTARLESIRVHPADGAPVEAVFGASLKDYGCFLAVLKRPLPAAALSGADILVCRRKPLLLANVTVQGEKRVAYFEPGRVESFKTGPKQKVYPQLRDGMAPAFLFDDSGNLLALPLPKRAKPSTQRYDHSGDDVLPTPAGLLLEALGNLPAAADPANVPLTEAEENRLAWMGVELQALNKELARANGVSDQTRDGETGALVTYVYPGSPAAQAGVEAGFVLLRLRTSDRPNPIEVKMEDDRYYEGNFPWEQLGEVPEQYFDRIPAPWPSVDNTFNRLLTDLGIGSRYTADFFAGGKLASKEFTAVAAPPYYDSAEKFKSPATGLTVRALTYEVRRYLQKTENEPGVIVSKVERGSKASVAGIKPYELITHINDQPVNSVEDFKKLSAGTDEMRLSVKRMAKGRIVNLKPAAPDEKKAAEDDEQLP